jgi:excisionase family DNA binding protein
MEDRNLSLSEVAGSMGVSERTVRRWIKSGKLRAYKPGRDYRIPESAVRKFVEESEISPKVRRRSPSEPSLFNGLNEERRAEADMVVHVQDLAEVAPGLLGEFLYTAEMRRVCIEMLEDGSLELRGYRS